MQICGDNGVPPSPYASSIICPSTCGGVSCEPITQFLFPSNYSGTEKIDYGSGSSSLAKQSRQMTTSVYGREIGKVEVDTSTMCEYFWS
ncbi:unnamed protein product [Protopolystoma xenopodis]|uniref:Uncharacterized protein n=1 Tax=Protopolystoma xenopodis TaxID=117903 RepID=A0A448XHQ1_9PLAT|nr:unnamed protein product [Protopolystoma xenopodis]